MAASIRITALEGVPEILPGQALDEVLATALKQNDITLSNNDTVVFCQVCVQKEVRRKNRVRRNGVVRASAQGLEIQGADATDATDARIQTVSQFRS